MKNIIVIGAGASGLLSAYFASQNGSKVTVIEKNSMIGRKIRITGKGRCNITNASDIEDIIKNICRNRNFMYSSLYSFTNDDVIELFKSYGLDVKVERGNRVFPASDKAIDVVKTLEKMVSKDNIDIVFNKTVKEVITHEGRVSGVKLNDGKIIKSDSVIIATGGLSYPLTGSTGDGYDFAKSVGHSITRLKPSLIGIEIENKPNDKMIGFLLKNISLRLKYKQKLIYEELGEIEFRNYGIDGALVKSASCFIEDDINKYSIEVDLKPGLSFEKLDNRIQRDFKKYNNKLFKDSLGDLLHKNIIDYILELSGIPKDKVVHQITREERLNFVSLLKSLDFNIKKLRPIEEAIITSGGVNVKEINPSTMESKLIEGLYFAGEVIDVDAYTGGYNLQITFSTGYLAGINSSM